MRKIGKIMVACDLSDYTRDALEYAAVCAVAHGAGRLLVNVVNQRDIDTILRVAQGQFDRNVEKYIETSARTYVDNVVKERTRQLDRIVEDLGIEGIEIRKVFKTGAPLEKLLEEVASESPDLVVMGPKGRGDLSGVLFGSVAEKMFRRCPVPLLSVRPQMEAK